MKKFYKLAFILAVFFSAKITAQMGCLTPSLGVYDAITYASMTATVPCTYTNIIRVSPTQFAVGNNATSPCMRVIIGLTNPNAATNNSLAIGEGTINPYINLCSSGCYAVLPNSTSYTFSLLGLDPTLNHGYNFCNTNVASNMNYTIASCYNSVPLSSGVWSNTVAGGCQTVNIPANSPIGIAVYSISPGIAPTASLSANTGDLYLDTYLMAQGIYTITYSFNSQAACSVVVTRTISITNPYVASWTAVGPYCSNASCVNLNPQITGTPGGTFTATSGVTSNSFCPSLSGPGTFPVTYTVGVSPTCGNTSTNNITVNAAPTVSIGGGPFVCSGNSALLSVVGAASSYTWNTGATTNTINVTPTVTTVYSVAVTNAAGCLGTAILNLSVNITPTVTASTPSAVCAFSTVCLSVSGASSYSWAGPCGFSSGLQNPCFPASSSCMCTYTVIGNSLGCIDIATVCINAVAPTIFNVSSTNSVLCVGQTATLTTNVGAMTYTWSTSATGSVIVVSPTTTTTYSVDGTNTNGCITGATFTQTVSTCAGINELSSNTEVIIFPNPAKEQITISYSSPIKTIKIFSVDGKLVLQKNNTDNSLSQTINISELRSGIYFVNCVIGGKENYFKVIKE